MINITLLTLVNSTAQNQEESSAFSRLFAIPFPSNIAYELRLLANQIQEHLKAFNDVKGDMITRYGTPIDGKTEKYKFSDINAKAYNEEINNLVSVEKSLAFNKIPFSLLEGYKISANDLMLLDWLIDFDN